MLGVAVAASFTDLKRHKIPNRLVVRALLAAILCHLVNWAAVVAPALISSNSIPWSEVSSSAQAIVINGVVGALIALAIYGAGLWSAGDAKLAMVLALAQPAWVPLRGPLPWGPVVVLLGNAIVAALAYLAIEIMLRGTPKVLARLRTMVRQRRWPAAREEVISGVKIALGMAALVTAIAPIRQWLAGRASEILSGGPFLAFLVLFILYKPLHRLTRSNLGVMVAVALFAASVLWTLWFRGGEGALEVLRSLAVVASVMAARMVLKASSRSFDARDLSIDQLEAGMILTDDQVTHLEAEKRYAEAFLPFIGDLRGVRLDANLVQNLREWHGNNAPEESFSIRSPLPFAPALAVAVILTAVMGRLCFRF
jgi:Flp pilus assembly protein protease CpaA